MDGVFFNQLHLWKVNASKAYLHIRGKSTDGGFKGLATR